jgi:hypothetical protein
LGTFKETKCEKGNKKKGENLEEKGITRDIKRKYKFRGTNANAAKINGKRVHEGEEKTLFSEGEERKNRVYRFFLYISLFQGGVPVYFERENDASPQGGKYQLA